jgi:hypothetical protein
MFLYFRLIYNHPLTEKTINTTRKTDAKNKGEIVAVHKELQEVSSKVDRILRTLIGDEEMAQEGLVTKVAKQEEWIEAQKVMFAKIFGIAIGSGVFGGAIIQLIMKMI